MPRARRQMRRRSVARVAVGSAVMAGTAGAVHHHQQKRWDAQETEQQGAYEDEHYPEEQYEAAPEEDVITQIERLGALKDQGLITEEEFAAKKAQLLGL